MVDFKGFALKMLTTLITLSTGMYLYKINNWFIIISILAVIYGFYNVMTFFATNNFGMYKIDTTTKEGRAKIKENHKKIIIFLIFQLLLIFVCKMV